MAINDEIESQKTSLQDCQALLAVAKEVQSLAQLRLEQVVTISEVLRKLEGRDSSPKSQSNSALSIMYQRVMAAKESMEEWQINDQQEAQDMLKLTSHCAFDLENEVDANKSMLALSARSLEFLVTLKKGIETEILPMKELLGARRRLPAELWGQIFLERVINDEEEYKSRGRDGTPPFTALKLSTVCQFWRAIVQGQPSLWQYIAIPRATAISRSQWDRVDHHRAMARGSPCIVYVVPDSRGEQGSTLHQYLLLQQFSQFRSLELRVSRRTSEAEDLLAATQPRVDELILIGSVKQGSSGTSCPLVYKALKNVRTLRCIDVHPSMRLSSPHTQQLPITSAYFQQTYLDSRSMIQFLEALPELETLTIDLHWPYTIEADNSRSPVIIHNLTNVNTSAAVLVALFTDEVMLPALQCITIQLSTESRSEELHWSTFLNVHQRRSSIKSLTLASEESEFSRAGIHCPETYAQMAGQIHELERLELKGDCVVAILERLGRPFPRLEELSISSSGVTEEVLEEFLEAYHAEKKASLRLRLGECPAMSTTAKARLMELAAHTSSRESK